jgi:hypothetical protein
VWSSAAHKQQMGCSGIRSATQFVALRDFSDLQLVRDYRFLEEALRVHSVAQRSLPPRPKRPHELPEGLQMLLHQASL